MNGWKSCQDGISSTLTSQLIARLMGPFAAVPATLRYCAICGSTDEICVQPWAVTILPLFGVTV